MRTKDALGRFGEDAAVRFLQEAGLRIVERNWRCAEGELDIVASDDATLVVVEVKTRTGTAFGSPAEAIGPAKAARLRRLTVRWLEAHRTDPDLSRWGAVRIDVVSVLRQRAGGVSIDHLVNVL